ncbi:dehydrogenase [Paenibacillus sp. H1-7]|nr:dehydrogenase [Paenibacillus sp. H1-7]
MTEPRLLAGSVLGIFVGHLSIGTIIQSGTAEDPDVIADVWYNMYEQKDRFEEIFPPGLDPSIISI